MIQKLQKWKINVLLHLIIISSKLIHMIQTKIIKRLANKYDLNEKIKALARKKEIKTLATKTELKAERDKIVNLQTHDVRSFISQSYFNNDGSNKNERSDEKLTIPTTTCNSLSSSIN